MEYKDILAAKRAAHPRLFAIPGVHCVAIGAKFVNGKATSDIAIQVFLPKKRSLTDLSPGEVVPPEIDGVKTDVIEEPMAKLLAATFPDSSAYSDLSGGMQIQAGNSVTGLGTLGCIATTADADGPVYAVTNHHVVALWNPQEPAGPLLWFTQPNESPARIVVCKGSAANLRLVLNLTLISATTRTYLGPFSYVTTAADTPTSIAAQIASMVSHPSITVTTGTDKSTWPQVSFALAPGFTLEIDGSFHALWAQTASNASTLSGANVPGSVVVASITLPGSPLDQTYFAPYRTVDTDTLATIAQGLSHEINVSGIPGVQSSNSGAVVTLTAQAGTTIKAFSVDAYKPALGDPNSQLQVRVSDQQLTIDGAVPSDMYGIYPAVSPGGLTASAGGFYAPPKAATTTAVTNSLASTFTALNVTGATVTSSAPQTIVIGNVEEVDCPVTSDVRVGQPTNNFWSACSACCGDRTIGRIVDASLAADIALIKLDPNTTYKAEILDVGYVAAPGSHTVTPQQVPPNGTFYVQKRGRTTGVTYGTVQSLDASGKIGGDVLHRFYHDAMRIVPLSPETPFSDHGDSGSAVLTCGTTPPVPPLPANQAVQVVGILFGGGGGTALATPIQTVLDRFQVAIATTSQLNQVLKAPAAAGSMSRQMHSSTPQQASRIQHAPARPLMNFLNEIEQHVVTTPGGERLISAVRKHVPETRHLIDTNRRVATTWHRCGGPTLLNAIVRSLQRHDIPVPREIEGRPLSECLQRMKTVLGRYGSPLLVADLNEYFGFFANMAGLTFAEALARLQRSGTVTP